MYPRHALGYAPPSAPDETTRARWEDFDEPPRPTVFAEVLQRAQRLQGQVCLTLMPIGAPVDWLRAMVEEGTISTEDLDVPS